MALSEEQKLLRIGKVTASNAGACLGLSRFKTQYKAYCDILGIEYGKEKPDPPWFKIGNYVEPAIIRLGSEAWNMQFETCTETLTLDGWLAGTADAWDEKNKCGFEAKNVSGRASANWGKESDAVEDSVPIEYLIQCMVYMRLYNVTDWYIGVLIGGSEFRSWHYRVTQEQIDSLCNLLQDWHYKHVVLGNIPECESEDDLRARWAVSKSECKEIPHELAHRVHCVDAARKQIKAAREEEEQHLLHLKNYMRDADMACTDEFNIAWKTNKNGTRPFLITERKLEGSF